MIQELRNLGRRRCKPPVVQNYGCGSIRGAGNRLQPDCRGAEIVVELETVGNTLESPLLGIGHAPGVFDTPRAITHQFLEPLSLVSRPGSPPLQVAGWRLVFDLSGQLSSQSQDGEIVLGDSQLQLLGGLDLRIHRDLPGLHGQSEVTAEKAIGLLAIVQLVVMRSRVGVLVPFKGLLFPEQPEEGPYLVVEVGFW